MKRQTEEKSNGDLWPEGPVFDRLGVSIDSSGAVWMLSEDLRTHFLCERGDLDTALATGQIPETVKGVRRHIVGLIVQAENPSVTPPQSAPPACNGLRQPVTPGQGDGITSPSENVTDNLVCQVCGGHIIGVARVDAGYCSSRCRQKAYRQRRAGQQLSLLEAVRQ